MLANIVGVLAVLAVLLGFVVIPVTVVLGAAKLAAQLLTCVLACYLLVEVYCWVSDKY